MSIDRPPASLEIRANFGKIRGAIAEHCRRRAFLRYKGGDFRSAIGAYSKALAWDPQNAWAYDGRGNARGETGDIQGALSDYRAATAIFPDHAGMLGNLGRGYRRVGDLDASLSTLDKAVTIDPAHARNHGFAPRRSGCLGGSKMRTTR